MGQNLRYAAKSHRVTLSRALDQAYAVRKWRYAGKKPHISRRPWSRMGPARGLLEGGEQGRDEFRYEVSSLRDGSVVIRTF